MATKKKAAKKATKKVAKPAEFPSKVDAREPVTVTIYGKFPNPIWVKGVDKNGKQYKIRVPKQFGSKLLSKQITVTPIDGELEEYYKWQP